MSGAPAAPGVLPPAPAPSPRAQVVRHGAEGEPVVIIDDCSPDPDRIIALAAEQAYAPMGAYFPGVRAPVPEPIVREMQAAMAELVRTVFGVERLNRIESYYSLITTPPAALTPLQRLPHFDGLGRQRIAMVHHLSREAKGGTAFYRHRSTGFETITEARLPAYNLAVNREVARQGLPPARYASAETPFYEQIAHYPARFNRMLIYRGNTLHSAEVPDDVALTASPRTGRFSVNTFLWLEA